MNNSRIIETELYSLVDENNYLLCTNDLRSLLPDISDKAFKSLIYRMCEKGDLIRLIKNIYLFKFNDTKKGNILYHLVNKLRDNHFNYLSLETVLIQEGIISQQMLQWITVMTTGRSNIIHCGDYGTIEFVHTKRDSQSILEHLSYNKELGLWVADVELSKQDMRYAHRTMELVEDANI